MRYCSVVIFQEFVIISCFQKNEFPLLCKFYETTFVHFNKKILIEYFLFQSCSNQLDSFFSLSVWIIPVLLRLFSNGLMYRASRQTQFSHQLILLFFVYFAEIRETEIHIERCFFAKW